MNTEEEKIIYLLNKYTQNSITKEEFEELFRLIKETETETIVKDKLTNDLYAETGNMYNTSYWQKVFRKILQIANGNKRTVIPNTRIFTWPRVAAAASILILFTAGIYTLITYSGKHEIPGGITNTIHNDVAPGGNKATLTLADGRTIVLETVSNGIVTKQGATEIKKQNNQLMYDASNAIAGIRNTPTYNTITTPRGGQFQITLPDGSKVWLNAASSIKFPIVFMGKERKVEIAGEAYFEVATHYTPSLNANPKMSGSNPNAKVPFIVSVNGMEVKVLGTHFNINAYPDEKAIKTTLLEGRVQVTSALNSSVVLSPNQQALLDAKGILSVKEIDPDDIIAWKDGLFRFDDANIQSIMRQLARWYNLDVTYETVPAIHNITGEVPKNISLKTLLKALEINDIHLKIEGRKVTVMP